MSCIIELQGYCTKEFGLVPKEVYLCTDEVEKYYIIKPIKKFTEFSELDKKTINWATKQYHFIPWSSGNIELGDFILDIKEATSKFRIIISKGAEKVAYLSSILNRPVIDLGLYGCPSVKKAEKSACPVHFTRQATCAVTGCQFLKNWLNGHADTAKLLGIAECSRCKKSSCGGVCE